MCLSRNVSISSKMSTSFAWGCSYFSFIVLLIFVCLVVTFLLSFLPSVICIFSFFSSWMVGLKAYQFCWYFLRINFLFQLFFPIFFFSISLIFSLIFLCLSSTYLAHDFFFFSFFRWLILDISAFLIQTFKVINSSLHTVLLSFLNFDIIFCVH